jgi:hypothetical protein
MTEIAVRVFLIFEIPALLPTEPRGGNMSLKAQRTLDSTRPMIALTLRQWPRATDADYHDEDPDGPVVGRTSLMAFAALAVAALCLIAPDILGVKL